MTAGELRRALPDPPATVLDLVSEGAEWTLWLAGQGYSPSWRAGSAQQLARARQALQVAPFVVQNRVEELFTGALSRLGDGGFDVLLLPDSGLLAPPESECIRLLKPGGVRISPGRMAR